MRVSYRRLCSEYVGPVGERVPLVSMHMYAWVLSENVLRSVGSVAQINGACRAYSCVMPC